MHISRGAVVVELATGVQHQTLNYARTERNIEVGTVE